MCAPAQTERKRPETREITPTKPFAGVWRWTQRTGARTSRWASCWCSSGGRARRARSTRRGPRRPGGATSTSGRPGPRWRRAAAMSPRRARCVAASGSLHSSNSKVRRAPRVRVPALGSLQASISKMRQARKVRQARSGLHSSISKVHQRHAMGGNSAH